MTATYGDGSREGPVSEPDASDVPPSGEADGAAVAEGEAAAGADDAATADESRSADEETFVDGTVGRSDLAAERDEYLEALQRVKAEFDNYRRRTEAQRNEMVDRAVGRIVEELLPVLDACDAAEDHGASEVEPIHAALLEALGREGLERMDALDQAFDPKLHEAVMHEPGDGGETVVVEVLRNGYLWKGHVLRPAMVKVRG